VGITARFKWTGYRKEAGPMTFKHFHPKTDPLMVGLKDKLLLMLDAARDAAKVPFILTSGLRTAAQNAKDPNAAKSSAHLKGEAVDIRCQDGHALDRMLYGLHRHGFSRIGIYVKFAPGSKTKLVPTHLHADIDPTKVQQTIWLELEK